MSELIEALISSDLREFEPRLQRHDLTLGHLADGSAIALAPYGRRVLLCGASGSGKSTLATALLERMIAQSYQFCLVDPEGDFDPNDAVLGLGDEQSAPKVEDVMAVLRSADKSVIANLLALSLDKRSEFLRQLLARCVELRARSGRPHWFVIDEAHHMLPAGEIALPEPIAHAPSGLLLITVHPDKLAAQVLEQIDTVIVVGPDPQEAFASYARAAGRSVPKLTVSDATRAGGVWLWSRYGENEAVYFTPLAPTAERRRHRRKYATGALGEDKSFYFRGPEDRLSLRAQNLMLFLQIGDGVDDETWLHHLQAHDYSGWVRSAIKNDGLAEEVEAIEAAGLDAEESRRRIREAVERIYTLPA